MSTPDTSAQALLVPVSAGELFDKLTILRIKLAHIAAVEKLVHIRAEAAALQAVADTLALPEGVPALVDELHGVNLRLWDIEDAIRDCERAQDFGARFVTLARDVYRTNDQRAHLKSRINELCGSALREEKSYAAY